MSAVIASEPDLSSTEEHRSEGQSSHGLGQAGPAAIMQRITRGLIVREAERVGLQRDAARVRVARRLGITPWSLANIARARVKRIPAEIRDRLITACISDLTRELARLEHERQLLFQMGESPSSPDMDEAEAALAAAREAIERMTKARKPEEEA